MRLTNPCYDQDTGTGECARVGIGNSTPPFALFVDSKANNTTAFGIRGKVQGAKTGIGTITPYNDSVWITYGCYLENNTWKYSPYEFPAGTPLRAGAALVLSPAKGAFWYAFDESGLINTNTIVGSWSLASGVPLWNEKGELMAGPSSRKIKEKFVPLNPDEFLSGIDQLEVSRWNYKSDNEFITHIGPTAEDFNGIFNLGEGTREDLYLIDEVGVSLAAVKALSGKISTQQKTIKELRADLKYLESQMSRRR
jgi:hypothetical protein